MKSLSRFLCAVFGQRRSSRRRRRTSAALAAEVLESRVLLSATPTLSSLTLVHDGDGDGVVSIPEVSGVVDAGESDYAMVEIDVDGDQMADSWAYPDPAGLFTQDLSSDLGFGPQTIHLRAVAWHPQTGEELTEGWSSLSFDYQAAPVAPPTLSGLSVGADGNGVVLTPVLTGTLTTATPGDYAMVEIDLDGDDMADAWAYPDSGGLISQDLSSDLSFGEQTIRVRAVAWHPQTGEELTDGWSSLSFDYQATPVAPPTLSDLSVGADAAGVVLAPVLTGRVTTSIPDGYAMIEIDVDGDDVADAWAYPDPTGWFEQDLSWDIGFGAQTIRVRAVAWHPQTGEVLTSGWSSLSFDYQSTVDPSLEEFPAEDLP